MSEGFSRNASQAAVAEGQSFQFGESVEGVAVNAEELVFRKGTVEGGLEDNIGSNNDSSILQLTVLPIGGD